MITVGMACEVATNGKISSLFHLEIRIDTKEMRAHPRNPVQLLTVRKKLEDGVKTDPSNFR